MTNSDHTRSTPPSADSTFAHLRRQHTVVATTFRRDGTPVATPVSLAVDPDDPSIGYMRTWSTAGKAKRLRRDRRITIAPSSFRGRPTGPPVEATATLLDGDRDRYARCLLGRKHPVLHRILVPLGHRLQRTVTQHYALSVATPPSRARRKHTSGSTGSPRRSS